VNSNIIDSFELKSISLSEQLITDYLGGGVEFYETYLRYFISFYADEPKDSNDKELGEENVFNKIDIIALRQQVIGVEKWFIPQKEPVKDVWQIKIVCKGFHDDIKCYTATEEEAQELFDKVQKYLLIN